MNLGTKIIEAVVRAGAIEKAIILENGNQIFVWRSNASEQIEAALEEINNEQTKTMNDPQNEPRTCPYCDQPRQDTFENRFRFECGTSLRSENHKTVKQGDACRLRVELRAAQAEVERLKEELEKHSQIVDDYGVPGSNFRICHYCKSESGAGWLDKGIPHDPDCILARAALAKKEESR